MGLIGTLIDFVRTTVDGNQVSEATLDPGGGDNVTAPHFNPPGLDSRPLPGDEVAAVDSTGSGQVQVTGYNDPKNAGVADAGEARLYSRDGAGVIKAVVFLKKDGTLVLQNDGGGLIELAPSGEATINGVTIDTSGNISTPGSIAAGLEVSAANAIPANKVTVSMHVHASIGAVPTPGT